MKEQRILHASAFPGITLESITERDLEPLRLWKNRHRPRFFFQGEISSAAQAQWFAAYQDRPEDWMFMIRSKGAGIACLGYRLQEDAIDIYNFLRDEAQDWRSRVPLQGFQLLFSYLLSRHTLPIRGRALQSNAPILRWIGKIGFRITGEGVDAGIPFYYTEFSPGRFPIVDVTEVRTAAAHLERAS